MFRFVGESRRDSESRGRKSLLAWHLNGVGDPEGVRSWLATQLKLGIGRSSLVDGINVPVWNWLTSEKSDYKLMRRRFVLRLCHRTSALSQYYCSAWPVCVGPFEPEAAEQTERGSILCFLRYLLLSLEAGPFRADDADFFSW